MGQANGVPTGFKGGALGLLVMAAGGFIVGIGLGVVPVPEESIHAPRWVIAAAGLAFLLAGVSVVQQAFQIERFKYAPGLLIVLSLAAVANWVAFGPGDRSGEGTFTVAGIQIPVSSDIAARLAFGSGAVVIDLLVILGFVHWFRNRSGMAPRRTRESLRARRRPAARPSPARSPVR